MILWYPAIGIVVSTMVAFSNFRLEPIERWRAPKRRETATFLLGVHAAIAVLWPMFVLWWCLEFVRAMRRRT